LVAYVGKAALGAALRELLRQRLPDPWIPSAFINLASLPVTRNGKVDRRALPAPQAQGGDADHMAPRDLLELGWVRIWEELLGRRRPIGVHESFFALGGHSLLAVRLISRIEAAYGRRLPVAAPLP